MDVEELPLPPVELRRIVGPTDPVHWNNPTGGWAFGEPSMALHVPMEKVYRRIFDFGCGAGRQARQLLQQSRPPELYVGTDISPELIAWCVEKLVPIAPHFRFVHHDVWSPTYAPGNTKRDRDALPAGDGEFTFANAHSVFTHLLQGPTEFYLRELHRILAPGGVCRMTCFLFNRERFPVLAPEQNCLYVNEIDPTQAVYYDWPYFAGQLGAAGFKLVDAEWTRTPGFHNVLWLVKGSELPDRMRHVMPPSTVCGY